MNVNMLHINFQPKQLWIADEKLKCLIHGLELRRGFFLSFFPSDTPHYENVPFEVPESWVWTTIEEICSKIGSGSTPRGSNYSANGIPFFRSQNVYNDRLVYDDIKYISEEVHQKMKGTEVLANDLLLNITGGSLGRCAVVPADFNCGNVSQHVCIMRSVLVEPEYFHVLVLSSYFAKSMKITGSGREGLPKYNLEQMGFPLPPLTEQQRIVAEIEHWFALIDQIEQGKADLQTIIKQTKSKILDLAIHGKLVPQDPNDEPAIELLKRINPDFTPCDNGHYTQLPDGWCVVTLKDLCENINGLWKGKKEPFVNVGVIRNANFTKDFKLDYSNIEYIDVEQRTFAKRHLENGDLIVEKSGGSDNNPVGRTILYEGKSGVFSFSNFTMALRTRNNDIVLSKFLYYYILAKYQKGDMRLMQTQTTGLRNLILDKFLSMPIHLPPLSEQKRIIDRIETIFTSLDMIMGSL
ncbi:restriction endonuclease subunit S [Phocaeicola dorei]|uniref:Restriction endonuclease subunit S n=1 Tax=Phocaeicola dorei TaxID=357276 RepID=A0AAE4S388_9BACT|nr:restriction endonuclease subunit S [Phocaeicola dorei]MDU0272366.1 restriction endonuclease subunit S [Phocaeicola dorei]